MTVKFIEENHEYVTISESMRKDWISVTSLISALKQPFDAKGTAKKVSKNKKSKWYGKTPEEIERIWKNEADRSTELGHFYHTQREEDLKWIADIILDGTKLDIYNPIYNEEGHKIAISQNLIPGLYPEHLVYLESVGVIGQIDKLIIPSGYIDIDDYKTNKEIKMSSFKNYEGIPVMMKNPVSHLEDCNFNHYALQLSMYAYMVNKHNPNLKVRNLRIVHVLFEEDHLDDNGYPVYKKDSNDNYIVKDTIIYPVPYLKKEVVDIFAYYKEGKIKK